MNIGIAGIGNMGSNIGARLIEVGHKLTVWNRTAEKTRPLADSGASVAKTPAELTSSVEVVISLLIDTAAPHLRGQIAIHWSTGARVSSLIYGCRLCDYLAVPGREQITFHDTKNGQRVEAAVHHPWAAAIMAEYLAWRGHLEDRARDRFF
jgi:hypothetical protein